MLAKAIGLLYSPWLLLLPKELAKTVGNSEETVPVVDNIKSLTTDQKK